ncbi:hypothetical protein [Brachyspira sp. G79]|nr:hypothetical protein [Brachyspira sp. G79]
MALDKELLEKLNRIEPRIKIQNKYFELNYNSIGKRKVWKYKELEKNN